MILENTTVLFVPVHHAWELGVRNEKQLRRLQCIVKLSKNLRPQVAKTLYSIDLLQTLNDLIKLN